jgi:hypothetical protein
MKLYMDSGAEPHCSGPEVLKDAEKHVQMVHESLKVALS